MTTPTFRGSAAYKRALEKQKQINDEGKRAKVENRLAPHKQYEEIAEEYHPKNIAQRELNKEIANKSRITFESRVYRTAAKIDAIRHEITPVELIRKTPRSVAIFAEIDHEFKPGRRNEENGSLRI